MRPLAVFLSLSSAIALGAAWACLPDLAAPVVPFCGDGYVDPDAGEECDPGSVDGSAACIGCQVHCGGTLPFVDPGSHHCYFGAADNSDIDGSAAGCEASGAHLVRFASEAELKYVVARTPTGPFWVGLEQSSSAAWLPLEGTREPGWAASCSGCYAHADGGFPIEGDAGGPCVVSQNMTQESWTQALCRTKGVGKVTRFTMCEREPAGLRARPCGAYVCLTAAVTEARKHYVLLNQRASASEAPGACNQAGASLVILESAAEREEIGEAIGAQTVLPDAKDYWVGLVQGANGAWAWEGDGGLVPPPWGDSEPKSPSPAAGRAYALVAAGLVDSELVRAAASTETHYPLCQR
ncbi:MAG TPA: C-type lectin domain-containing protein [Polyangiaceae bacterium]